MVMTMMTGGWFIKLLYISVNTHMISMAIFHSFLPSSMAKSSKNRHPSAPWNREDVPKWGGTTMRTSCYLAVARKARGFSWSCSCFSLTFEWDFYGMSTPQKRKHRSHPKRILRWWERLGAGCFHPDSFAADTCHFGQAHITIHYPHPKPISQWSPHHTPMISIPPLSIHYFCWQISKSLFCWFITSPCNWYSRW